MSDYKYLLVTNISHVVVNDVSIYCSALLIERGMRHGEEPYYLTLNGISSDGNVASFRHELPNAETLDYKVRGPLAPMPTYGDPTKQTQDVRSTAIMTFSDGTDIVLIKESYDDRPIDFELTHLQGEQLSELMNLKGRAYTSRPDIYAAR